MRGRLQRSHATLLAEWREAGEPVTDELLWRWIKAKGGLGAAESALLTHAQWRVSLGRIERVSRTPSFWTLCSRHKRISMRRRLHSMLMCFSKCIGSLNIRLYRRWEGENSERFQYSDNRGVLHLGQGSIGLREGICALLLCLYERFYGSPHKQYKHLLRPLLDCPRELLSSKRIRLE